MTPLKLIYKKCNPQSVVPVNIQNLVKNGKNIKRHSLTDIKEDSNESNISSERS